MKENLKSCDPVLISRFFDKELGPEEYIKVAGHIRSCPSCRKELEGLETVSGKLREHFTQIPKTGYAAIGEKVIRTIRKKEAPWWMKLRDIIFSKGFLIPASAVASAAIIFLTLFRPPAVSGPSAIITSLTGVGSSIVVMETPRTRQTILWFDERG